jgi:hypothetical protein
VQLREDGSIPPVHFAPDDALRKIGKAAFDSRYLAAGLALPAA